MLRQGRLAAERAVIVGIIDSGVAAALAGRVAAARQFTGQHEGIAACPDRLGQRAAAVARLILDAVPALQLVAAQVFERGTGQASPAAVAAALDWLSRQGARLRQRERLGLTADRAVGGKRARSPPALHQHGQQ